MKHLTGLMVGAAIYVLLACIGCASTGDMSNGNELSGNTKHITADANRILRAMGNHLKASKQFEFTADVTYDALVDGDRMVQYGGRANVNVDKPGRLRAVFSGDERKTAVYYNGSTFTLHDLNRQVYSVTKVPPTIDDAVDQVVSVYGFTVPLADFVYTDPYKVMIEKAVGGFVVGIHNIEGTPCHHLAFSQPNINWQIWIQAGPNPVPRKLVITYRNSLGSQQYTARLSNWNLNPDQADALFEFVAPAGADQIELLPIGHVLTQENE